MSHQHVVDTWCKTHDDGDELFFKKIHRNRLNFEVHCHKQWPIMNFA